MKPVSLGFCLLMSVAALCAGCAADPMHASATAADAVGPSQTQCADGTVLPANSRCSVHGGARR